MQWQLLKSSIRRSKRYVIEFTLILISVALAFYFEELRERRQIEANYINTLLDFRNDVHRFTRGFSVTYDSSNAIVDGSTTQSWLLVDKLTLHKADSIINHIYGKKDLVVGYFVNDSIGAYTDWRFPSNYLDALRSFPVELVRDSLNPILNRYNQLFNEEFTLYEVYNEELEKFKSHIYGKIDPYDLDNIPTDVSNSLELKWTIYQLNKLLDEIIEHDQYTANEFSYLLSRIDARLTRLGVDTAKLDKKYMVKKVYPLTGQPIR